MTEAHGISAVNRERLEALHRRLKGPFSVSEAAAVWALDATRARRLAAYLAARGWLSRVRRDSYTTVPLGATSPKQWREDPWLVAATTFAPCYLGGWTACEHWGLTEQIFREMIVITTRRVRHRREEIQGTRFRVKVIASARMFGLVDVWRAQNQVKVSDPARTIVDLLADPALGGGMRHVADVLRNYFEGTSRNDDQLADYAGRIGNRTVFKRLGYLLETLGIHSAKLSQLCARQMSTGISLLDPSGKPTGSILKRWGLRVNVKLSSGPE
jgi:predicted transcriptional regulator of viral defense system